MNKCKILIPIGCRSDEGISKPIIKRLKENEMFEVKTRDWNKIAGSFRKPYIDMNTILTLYKKSDLVFITGDRIEMTACACYCFHNHIPIAHYLAGVINYPISTLDDINRHCISLWSNIQLVESIDCMLNIQCLFNAIAKRHNCYIVGSTYLDDIEIDTSLVPGEEYDLVLYNPTTLYKEDIIRIAKKRFYKNTIWVGPNPDPSFFDIKRASEISVAWCTPKGFRPNPTRFEYYENLPREQFLGLLKNCKRFITNSSCAYYEAPYFLKPEQIIIIGDRNKNRSSKFHDLYNTKCASDNIISVLEGWWLSQNE